MFWRKYFIKKVVVIAFIAVLAVSTAFLIKNIYKIGGKEKAEIPIRETYSETVIIYPEKQTFIEWSIVFLNGGNIDIISVKISYEGLLNKYGDLQLEYDKESRVFILKFLSFNFSFRDKDLLNKNISKMFIWNGRKLNITLFTPPNIKTIKLTTPKATSSGLTIIMTPGKKKIYTYICVYDFSKLPEELKKMVREKVSQTSFLKELLDEKLDETIVKLHYSLVKNKIVIKEFEITPIYDRQYNIIIELKEKWNISASKLGFTIKNERLEIPSFKLVRKINMTRNWMNINKTMKLIMKNKALGKILEKIRIEKFVITCEYADEKIQENSLKIFMSNNAMRINVGVDLLEWKIDFINIYLKK